MYPGKLIECQWAKYFATQFISVNNPRRRLVLCGRIPCFLGTTFANQVLSVLVYMQLVTAFTDPCWRTKLKMKVDTTFKFLFVIRAKALGYSCYTVQK